MNPYLEILIPVKTVSEANISEHWSKKSKRKQQQKALVKIYLSPKLECIKLPCTILLKRIGKRRMDSDNLTVSMKYCRDAIANLIFPGLPAGKADDSPEFTWAYDQKIGKEYAVIVSFSKIQ